MKKLIVGFVMGSMMTGAVALAAGNVSKARHPNLAAAQKFIDQAWEKVTAAQKANEFDMDGHAAKAKDLLEQARAEIKQAAEEANENTPK